MAPNSEKNAHAGPNCLLEAALGALQCRDVLREGARHGHLGFAVQQLRSWRLAVGLGDGGGPPPPLPTLDPRYRPLADAETALLGLLDPLVRSPPEVVAAGSNSPIKAIARGQWGDADPATVTMADVALGRSPPTKPKASR